MGEKSGDVIKIIKSNKKLQKAVDILVMSTPVFDPEDFGSMPDCIFDVIDDEFTKLLDECLRRNINDVYESGKERGTIPISDVMQEVCQKLSDKLSQDDFFRAGFWSSIFATLYDESESDDDFIRRLIEISEQTERVVA